MADDEAAREQRKQRLLEAKEARMAKILSSVGTPKKDDESSSSKKEDGKKVEGDKPEVKKEDKKKPDIKKPEIKKAELKQALRETEGLKLLSSETSSPQPSVVSSTTRKVRLLSRWDLRFHVLIVIMAALAVVWVSWPAGAPVSCLHSRARLTIACNDNNIMGMMVAAFVIVESIGLIRGILWQNGSLQVALLLKDACLFLVTIIVALRLSH